MIERCAVQQNPGGVIICEGSSDRSGGCLELREEWRMHHDDELSIFHLNPVTLLCTGSAPDLPGNP